MKFGEYYMGFIIEEEEEKRWLVIGICISKSYLDCSKEDKKIETRGKNRKNVEFIDKSIYIYIIILVNVNKGGRKLGIL